MFTLISLIIWLLAVTVALTIHEASHAFMSDRLGDPTARLSGRLSLDPREHWDPVGTTMLFVTAAMAAFGIPVIPFGWAKPVMFDPYNLENPKRDAALIAIAGPASNFLFAILISLLFRLFLMELPLINLIAVAFITVNVALGIFNLIPINPLDGSKVLYGILPRDLANEFNFIMSRFGTLILILLIVPFGGGASPLTLLISPLINSLLILLLP